MHGSPMVNCFEGHINRIREKIKESRNSDSRTPVKDKSPNPYCRNLFVSEKKTPNLKTTDKSVKPLYATRKEV